MSVKEVTFYQAVCDRCGHIDDEGEYAAWAQVEGAIETATGNGWLRFENDEGGDELYCERCTEWDEEADELRPKPIEAVV